MLSAREMENKDYTDLDVWKEARKLVSGIYSLVKSFPEDEKYALTSQLKRAAISVPSNIAEGVGRQHKNERIQFLYISRGSLYEIETQLFLALDQSFLSEKSLKDILDQITSCKKLIQGYINYLKK
jgi:four helix bundle protein